MPHRVDLSIDLRACAIGVLLMTVSGLLTACNGDDGLFGEGGPDVGHAPERHRIDEHVATYRGVGFRDSATEVTAAFGRSPPLRNDPVTPLGRNHTYVDLAPSFRCVYPGPGLGSDRTMRYEQVSFFLNRDLVCGFAVIEDGAATNRRVAVGDPLREAEDAYPDIECGTANEGTEYATFPYCAGRLRPSKYIWFGGNPINTIQMNNEGFN
jgi:hypothetical protein